MKELFFSAETWQEDDEQTVAFVVLNGIGNRVVNEKSHTTYEIVSGTGTFMVGCRSLFVGPGSTIDVPAGMIYQDESDLTMIATSKPPFDPEAVTIVNNR